MKSPNLKAIRLFIYKWDKEVITIPSKKIKGSWNLTMESIRIGEHYANLPECPQDPWTVNADIWPLLGLSGGTFFNWNDLSLTTLQTVPNTGEGELLNRPASDAEIHAWDLRSLRGNPEKASLQSLLTWRQHTASAPLQGSFTSLTFPFWVSSNSSLPVRGLSCGPRVSHWKWDESTHTSSSHCEAPSWPLDVGGVGRWLLDSTIFKLFLRNVFSFFWDKVSHNLGWSWGHYHLRRPLNFQSSYGYLQALGW